MSVEALLQEAIIEIHNLLDDELTAGQMKEGLGIVREILRQSLMEANPMYEGYNEY